MEDGQHRLPQMRTDRHCRSQGSSQTGGRRGRTLLFCVHKKFARIGRYQSPSNAPYDRTNLHADNSINVTLRSSDKIRAFSLIYAVFTAVG